MKSCPTCHRPFHRSGRFCYACDKPMSRGHRYHFVGCYIQHDDCANPTLDPRQETPLLAPSDSSQGDAP